jgi:hypothetical protein
MKAPVDAARLLRESNPVADDAFADAAGDSLGRATFERIIDRSPEPEPVTGRALRWRGRRLALHSMAAAMAALAAGVALAAVGVPGAHDTGADAAAYVVKRVDGALSAAEPGKVAQVKVTTRRLMPNGTTVTTTGEEWSYGDQWRSVVDSSAGRPVYDEGSSTASLYTVVSYPKRTWARQHEAGFPAAPAPLPTPASGPQGCEPVIAALPVQFLPGPAGIHLSASSPAAVARALRAAISCGTLSVAGRERVDGIDAIKLTSSPDEPSMTIWVSPGTYLPLRVVVRSTGGHGVFLGDQLILQQTAEITWLPPTTQNLAKLTVPIPAGFRQVPLAQAVWSILQQTPAGLSKSVTH